MFVYGFDLFVSCICLWHVCVWFWYVCDFTNFVFFTAQELAEEIAKEEAVRRAVNSAKLDWGDTTVLRKGCSSLLDYSPFHTFLVLVLYFANFVYYQILDVGFFGLFCLFVYNLCTNVLKLVWVKWFMIFFPCV